MQALGTLTESIRSGNFRAITRAITLAENHAPAARELQSRLFPYTGRAYVLGVTGAPGAGKSTFVDSLALALSKEGKKIGIIAVDPTSPFTGGAVLGDRIRMQRVQENEGVFMRSMATRGSLGGVADAVFDAVQILDAAGMEVILVETVGVGQAEVDIVRLSDTCLVLLVPGLGDGIQAMKAGLLEIADIFIVNKSDRDGSDAVERDIRVMLSFANPSERWVPPVVKTVATDGRGIPDVLLRIAEHKEYLGADGALTRKREERIREQILMLLVERVRRDAAEKRIESLARLVAQCTRGEISPHDAARMIFDDVTSLKA